MLAAANQHWLTICFFADTRTSPSWTSRRAQSSSPRNDWVGRRASALACRRHHEIELEPRAYDLWHDRAVFHFLTTPEQRLLTYGRLLAASKPGGHVIVSTFGPEGPTKCSGLEVMRYDAESLHGEFGARFRLVESSKEMHHTPFGTTQQFLYCYCRID